MKKREINNVVINTRTSNKGFYDVFGFLIEKINSNSDGGVEDISDMWEDDYGTRDYYFRPKEYFFPIIVNETIKIVNISYRHDDIVIYFINNDVLYQQSLFHMLYADRVFILDKLEEIIALETTDKLVEEMWNDIHNQKELNLYFKDLSNKSRIDNNAPYYSKERKAKNIYFAK